MYRPSSTVFFLLGVVSCAPRGVFPTIVIPKSPSAADWPDAGAAVLEDVAALNIKVGRYSPDVPRSMTAVIDHRVRLKILSDTGRAAADVTLAVDAFSRVSEIVARAVLPGGEVVDMPSSAIRLVSDEEGGDADLATVRFSIPGAVVGGLVEYRYRRTFRDVALLPTWIFGSRYPVVRAELAVTYGNDVKLDYRYGVGEKPSELLPLRQTASEGRDRLVFVQRDLPAYYAEPDAVHPSRYAPWLALVASLVRVEEDTRRIETWEDISSLLDERVRRVGRAKIMGPPSTIYRSLRDSARALPYEGLLGTEQRAAASLLVGTPATSRDISSALRNTLVANGIEAALALVAGPTGPLVLRDFPGLYGFMRALVAIRVHGGATLRQRCKDERTRQEDPSCRLAEGDVLFVDPACRRCRYGELSWQSAGGEALVLWPKKPAWVTLPTIPPKTHRLMLEYDLNVDNQGVIKGKLEGRASGSAAAWLLEQWDGRSVAQLEKLLFAGGARHPKISEARVVAEGDGEKELSFTALIESKVEKRGYGEFMFRLDDVTGPVLQDEVRSSRRTDAVLRAPRQIEQVLKLDWPQVFTSDALPEARLARKHADYSGACARKERTLFCSERLRLNARVVPAKEWDDFKRFTDELAEHKQHGVRIYLAN